MHFTFDSGGIFGSCFTYLFAGVIAGTIASFVVRGKFGCMVVNFALGILGAVVANLALNLIAPLLSKVNIPNSTGFFGITVFASITATAIALIFNWALKAESRHQQHLLAKYPRPQEPGAPKT